MMIATFHDSIPIFLFSFLGVFLCAAPVLWAKWTLKGARKDLVAAAVLTATLAIALIAGEQSWVWLPLPPEPSSPRSPPAGTSGSGAAGRRPL